LVNLVRKGEDASQSYFKGRFETKIREWMRKRQDKDVDTGSTDLKDEFSNTFGGENQISQTEEDYGMFTNTPQILTINRSDSYQKAAEAVMVAEKVQEMLKKLKVQLPKADQNMLLAAATAIVIFSLSTMIYFIAGKDLFKLLVFIPAGAAAFFFLIKAAPYRFNRLVAFMNPSADPLGVTYHINQILISLANGGMFGKGFGASRQKYLYLPEPHTDSIFAIIGEEFGFIGAAVLVIAFAMLVYMLYRVYEMAPDNYGKLLAGGIFVFFSLQTIVNLGGMVNIMPLTGVPLPFISYGGSHILISFVLMGIAINIARQGVKNPSKQ
jgi:cell division protein FtsW